MDYLKYSFLFLTRFFLFPIYLASGLSRRDKNTWVFGSWGGHRFADNAAAFFLFCHERVADEIRLVWISRDRAIVSRLRDEGFESYWIWSPSGIRATLSASTFIFDCFVKDINYWLSRGARKVNLWSGVPLKVFERDIDVPSNRYYRLFHGTLPERLLLGAMMPWHVDKPDLIIATSDEMASITMRAFALRADQVHTVGFPRNDVMLNGRYSPSKLVPQVPRKLQDAATAGSKVFLYLPTFRDSNRPYMDIDWLRLSEKMRAMNAVFFYKTHPMDKLKNDVDQPNIFELPQKFDVYDALPLTDVLISDYSSIIFDFMLTNKPIVYYTPDLKEFVSGSRSLLFQPEEIAVGPVCKSFEELLQAIDESFVSPVTATDGRKARIMSRIHKLVDGKSSERILNLLLAE